MSNYVGPNGRLYQRASHRGRWIAITIICTAVIGLAIVGVPNVAIGFGYLGL